MTVSGPSVIIAAHDEEAVIGATLDALLADARPGEFEVIVSANGCSDDTAGVARRRAGVVVVESPSPGKTGALNRAEVVATGWPRVYLDADIAVSTQTVRALCAALETGPALVATPDRVLDTTGRPVPVRAYYAIQRRLPVFEVCLMGRGLIVVSEEGRVRFGAFPDVVADDLFLDAVFTAHERVRLDVTTTVATPFRTRDLVRRLARVRRGNAALRAQGSSAGGGSVRSADRGAWVQVVRRHPRLAPAAVVYVALTAWAELSARRPSSTAPAWGRDESTRALPGAGGAA